MGDTFTTGTSLCKEEDSSGGSSKRRLKAEFGNIVGEGESKWGESCKTVSSSSLNISQDAVDMGGTVSCSKAFGREDDGADWGDGDSSFLSVAEILIRVGSEAEDLFS